MRPLRMLMLLPTMMKRYWPANISLHFTLIVRLGIYLGRLSQKGRLPFIFRTWRFWKMFKNAFLVSMTFAILFLCNLAFASDARKELVELGIPYTLAAMEEAIKASDLLAIDLLLGAGMDPDGILDNGETPLTMSVGRGNIALVERLIAADAKVNGQIEREETALIRAARGGHSDIVSLLLSQKDVYLEEPFGYTPLYFAATQGYADIVRLMLDAGAEVNVSVGKCKSTILADTAGSGHVDVVTMLLAAGAEIDAMAGCPRRTAIYRASMEGHVDVVATLLANCANVNRKSPGDILIHYMAADNGHTEISEMLKSAGANWWGRKKGRASDCVPP